MMLEAERFANPVLREFYKEKDVVMEERRMMENSPTGRLYEEFQGIAFLAHPYGEGVIGHMSDLQTLTRGRGRGLLPQALRPEQSDHRDCGRRRSGERQATGPEVLRRHSQRARSRSRCETVEPPQRGERRVTVEDAAQPIVLIGYHQPNVNHPDSTVLEVLAEIVGVGRTSRLYKNLVKDKKIAVSANAGPMPSKYPSLFMFYRRAGQGPHEPGVRAGHLRRDREAQDRAGVRRKSWPRRRPAAGPA